MTRPTFAATAGFAVVIALGFVGFGCSSGSTSGTGGTTGSGGASTGGATGTGGKTGTGGATGAGGADAGAKLPTCSGSPADNSACNSDPSCVESCGLNIMALTLSESPVKACTCSGPTASGGKWSCPSTNGACMYPTDIDLSCFNLPSPLPLCVVSSADGGTDGGSADAGPDGGAALIKSGSTHCDTPPSEVCGNVCGSATVNTYLDGKNAPNTGYCACISGTYQCASVNEWPAAR